MKREGWGAGGEGGGKTNGAGGWSEEERNGGEEWTDGEKEKKGVEAREVRG